MKRFLALALVALLAACSRESTAPRTVSAEGGGDDTPQDGGVIHRRLDTDVSSLNPILATSRYDRIVANTLFTPLIGIDIQLRPIPALAESWEIAKDGLTFTFRLNPKATFSDGTPVRAADVVFTLRKALEPAAEAVQVGASFTEVDLARTTAVDDHTVVIGMKQPMGGQLVRFYDLNVLPEHVYGKGDFAKDFNERAVGSGPYRLVRRTPGKEVVVERRTDYWGKKPYIQTIVFKVISDHGTAWSALRRGELDEGQLTSDTWAHERSNPQNARILNFLRFYTLSYNFITWNEHNPLFTDKRMRQALAMCIDRSSLINGIYSGTARAMSGPFTPDDWAYNPTVPVTPYDPAAAKRQLAALGWLDTNGDGILDRGGKPLRFDFLIMAGSAQTVAFAQMYQNDLKKIGVAANVLMLEATTAIQRILTGNYDAAYLGLDLDPDPDPYSILHSTQTFPRGQNFAFYNNPEIDRMLDQARHEINQARRAEIYRQMHVILQDEQPYTWVIQVSSKWAVSKRVHNVVESPRYGLMLWSPGELDWWLERAPGAR